MKRILSLDGGGIRGVYTLEILLHIEKLLRDYYKKQDAAKGESFVLRDHFDFFAGTSTGAIIATCLCWGMTVETVMDMYVVQGGKMFQPVPWYRPIKKLFFARFNAQPLGEMLKSLFLEADGSPALLGSQLLLKRPGETCDPKLLLVAVRNHSTGSAWPLTNNPDALYNDRRRDDCNLDIPLWELVRASTAAPTYFEAAQILMGLKESVFIDGSITPYCNPALIAALTVLLPGYRVNWTPGPEDVRLYPADWTPGPKNIRLISVGTISFSSELPVKNPKLWLGYNAAKIPAALLAGAGWQQDYLCRCLGECIFGETLDSEVGDLRLDGDLHGIPFPGQRLFSYVRYNRTYKKKEMESLLSANPRLARIDAIDAIPILRDIGRAYAEQNVKLEHLI